MSTTRRPVHTDIANYFPITTNTALEVLNVCPEDSDSNSASTATTSTSAPDTAPTPNKLVLIQGDLCQPFETLQSDDSIKRLEIEGSKLLEICYAHNHKAHYVITDSAVYKITRDPDLENEDTIERMFGINKYRGSFPDTQLNPAIIRPFFYIVETDDNRVIYIASWEDGFEHFGSPRYILFEEIRGTRLLRVKKSNQISGSEFDHACLLENAAGETIAVPNYCALETRSTSRASERLLVITDSGSSVIDISADADPVTFITDSENLNCINAIPVGYFDTIVRTTQGLIYIAASGHTGAVSRGKTQQKLEFTNSLTRVNYIFVCGEKRDEDFQFLIVFNDGRMITVDFDDNIEVFGPDYDPEDLDYLLGSIVRVPQYCGYGCEQSISSIKPNEINAMRVLYERQIAKMAKSMM